MALHPLAESLVVKADPVPDKYVTTGGMQLETAPNENSKLPLGTILEKGDGVRDDLKVGMRIFCRKYCFDDITVYDDEGRLIPNIVTIKQEDVIGYDDGKGGMNLPKEIDA